MRPRPLTTALCAGSALVLGATSVRAEAVPDVDEVVVTALKRKTLLRHTPEAVTIIAGAPLARRGVQSLADLPQLAPNVSFSENLGVAQIFIRGVGDIFAVPGGDPGVAVNVDDAYVSDPQSINTPLFDLERIEVLRGPQGAFWGRNATGGAVNLISAAPTERPEARLGVVIGDYDRREMEGHVSGPLGGGAEGRLSLQLQSLGGYTRNALAGRPGAPDRLDDRRAGALRGQLALPVGGGRLRLIAGYSEEDDNGPAQKVLADARPQPAQLLFGALPDPDPRAVESQLAVNKRRVLNGLARYDKSLGGADLTLLASARSARHTLAADQDGTEASQAFSFARYDSLDLSLDVRLAAPADARTPWLVGATYVDFRQDAGLDVVGLAPLGVMAPGAPLTVGTPFRFAGGGELRSRSAAVYGDIRHAVGERVTVFGGLRYTFERKSADEYLTFLVTSRAHPAESWSNLSGELGVEVELGAEATGYARLARGFKAGAINLGGLSAPVDPELITSLETGFKSAFWNDKGKLRIAAFASRYEDLQVAQVGALTTVLANAAQAHMVGIEAEGGLQPIEGLTLSASFAFNDAEFEDFITPDARRGLAAVDLSGARLPQVSRTSFNLGFQYDRALPGGYVGHLGAAYAWRSAYYFTVFNTRDARQGAYGLLDLSAGVSSRDRRWNLYAYLRNVGDKRAVASMLTVSPLLGGMRMINLAPPRRLGVGLDWRY
jgi:outer membrane receptor protein involved in Fe transport